MLLSDYLDMYMEVRLSGLADNTIKGYRTNIKHLNSFIGEMKLTEIKPIHIQKTYTELLETLSGTSVLYCHRVLSKALNYAVLNEYIDKNPCERVIPPKKTRYNATVLTYEQSVYLLNGVKGTEMFVPIMLGLLLGLRRGEVLGLKYSDFDFSNLTVSIQRSVSFSKGNRIASGCKTKFSYRTLLLSQKLFYSLLQNIGNKSGYICDITVDQLQYRFKRTLKELDLPNIRFHDLRHSCATLMLKNNIPAKIVCDRLGHSGIGITLDLYTHVSVEMQAPAAVVFDSMI